MVFDRLRQLARRILIANPRKANYKFVLKDWVSLGDLGAISKVLETKRFSQNLDPIEMQRPDAQSVLVISPHPDDDVFCSGGTILKMIRAGCRVKVVYLTSGSRHTYEDEHKGLLARQVAIREKESLAVSTRLGTDIEFWRYSSKGIKIDDESITRLRNAYTQVRPKAVFMPFIADDHIDHRKAVQLFYEAFKRDSRVDFEIWAYQGYSTVIPNVVVDITDVMEEKTRLIELWESQKKSRDWAHFVRGLNAFNSRFLKTNQARYVETFFVVPANEYIELCKIYFRYPSNETCMTSAGR